MNQITPPAKIEIIPSSAPFSEAQRSWLNGFFAGLLSDATPLSAEQGAAVMEGAAGDGAAGLRPVRLRLSQLLRGDCDQERSAAQPLRPRRQGNRADAQIAL